jgi:hypothetical protein
LRRWTREATAPSERHHLADDCLMACEEVIGDVGEKADFHGLEERQLIIL